MSASAQKAVYQDEHEMFDVEHSDAQPRRRVLLIDEQAHVLRVMRLNLNRYGYEVEMAMSSENALRLVQDNQYGMVIITSDLPDMSAQQLYENFEVKVGLLCPATLVGTAGDDSWINSTTFAERLEKPVSLVSIVARLSEAFGDINK